MTSESTKHPTRIAVGMSGGLDSTVVASLCLDQGHEVVGVTLHMFKEGSRCCSIEDVQRAKAVCDRLGIPHYTINAMRLFEELIVAPFVDSYARGRTPSPCILCNEHIKFGILHRRALQMGCTRIATGHYARIGHQADRLQLMQPTDKTKDQTYFLHRLSQEQLGRCLFPLEGWTKDDARVYARERDLPVPTGAGQESQDLCFVADDGHAVFVEERRPELAGQGGEVVDRQGEVLGTHGGIHRYTIGQRQGLGIAAPTRRYVNRLDPGSGQLVLGPREEVLRSTCEVSDVHWIAGSAPGPSFRSTARIRYRHRAAAVQVDLLEDERLRLSFEQPQFAITPGQAAVLYNGEEVLGGGWIES